MQKNKKLTMSSAAKATLLTTSLFTTLLLTASISKPALAEAFCQTLPQKAKQDLSKIKFTKVLELKPLTPGFAVLEGPVWMGDSLWMSHIGMPSDKNPNPADIIAYRDGKVSTVKKGYGANGLSFNAGGELVAARHLDGTITRVDDGKVLAAKYAKKRFNSPNDLVISAAGDIYFSDPDWQNPQPSQAKQLMYHVSTSGKITGFGSVMEKPNGVMLSKDETSLYTGGVNGMFKYALKPDGSVIDKPQPVAKAAIPEGVDGMSRDCAGNLYVTAADKLHILAAYSDKVLASYPIPKATNVAFGGKNLSTIYVTTLGEKPSLWQANSAIPGLPY
ncbi:MAG: SMP-30/gluconolactonase/LRE family protein [Cellvibrionaceae bacterium]|nr:SMP-30/gluconolactonase/LRE family protein [Cellvibrionaceae bacterium]